MLTAPAGQTILQAPQPSQCMAFTLRSFIAPK